MGDRSTYAVWVRWVALGEFTGFLLPSAVGVATVLGGVPQLAQSALLVLAGAGEGAVLGAAQAHVLVPRWPGLGRRRWVGATAAGAAVAWTIGMLPATLGERLTGVPLVVLVPVAGLLGVALLLSIGLAQYAVLRHLVPSPHRWVGVTALAWLVGLAAVFAVMGSVPSGTAWTVAGSVAGGLVMATAMALVTGREVVRWSWTAGSGGAQRH